MVKSFINEYVGLILAAGYGTRLRPYTNYIPKPLLPFCGSPIIKHAISRLSNAGIEHITINTHHLHEQIEEFIKENYLSKKNDELTGNTGNTSTKPVDIYLSFEESVLGTGGVYSKIKDRISGKNIVVYNSDIISDIDIQALMLAHYNNPQRVSTMVVTDYKEGTTPLYVGEDGNLVVLGNEEELKKLDKLQKCSFCAVSVVSSALIDLLPQEGFSSIIDAYKKALTMGLKIGTYYHNGLWEDIGDKSSFRQAYIKLFSDLKKKHYKSIEIYLSELGL